MAFTGDWTSLFGHFDDSAADLLGTTLTPYESIPGRHWWCDFSPPERVERKKWVRRGRKSVERIRQLGRMAG